MITAYTKIGTRDPGLFVKPMALDPGPTHPYSSIDNFGSASPASYDYLIFCGGNWYFRKKSNENDKNTNFMMKNNNSNNNNKNAMKVYETIKNNIFF